MIFKFLLEGCYQPIDVIGDCKWMKGRSSLVASRECSLLVLDWTPAAIRRSGSSGAATLAASYIRFQSVDDANWRSLSVDGNVVAFVGDQFVWNVGCVADVGTEPL